MVKFTEEDDALLDELGVEAEPASPIGGSARGERIIAGFEDIQCFVDSQGRIPHHGENQDIFERLYAVRLDRLRALTDFRGLLEPMDHQKLLNEAVAEPAVGGTSADDRLLADLGVEASPTGLDELKHVRSSAERRAAEEIATSRPCEDFAQFESLFTRVAQELKSGLRQAQPIVAGARAIEPGDFFILEGLTVYVAEVGEPLKTTGREIDSRLRVIYSNGTESNLLLRSLQRAFYNDPAARRLTSPSSGQLGFGDTWETDDVESGTIYVLESLSADPRIDRHRELIHKIGVTGGSVEARIANAEVDATYLLAEVKVVATYKLAGVNRSRLENLFHRLFAGVRLDIEIQDRFGNPVKPREWFLVPLPVIDEAVERLRNGTITDYVYDPKAARLIKIGT